MLLHLATLILIIYFPLTQLLFFKRERERLLTVPGARLEFYRSTSIALWVIAALLALLVFSVEIAWEELGFRLPSDWRFYGVLTVILIASVFMAKSSNVTPQNYTTLRDAYAHVRFSLPANPKEFRYLCVTAVTAGVTEEFIYRAFLFWYFSQSVNVLLAVLLANLVFCLGHLWSGPKNMFGAFVLGLGFSAIYWLSGSLLTAMLAHAVVDIYAGKIGLGLAQHEDSMAADSGSHADLEPAGLPE